MEPLRWILLAGGIAFILLIYVIGRNRRRRNNESTAEDLDDDLPEFSAQHLDDIDEGVGEVRIVTGEKIGVSDSFSSLNAHSDDGEDTNLHGDLSELESDMESSKASVDGTNENSKEERNEGPSDIIVLYILPKSGEDLIGSQINSSAQAMGLSFGEMNIFHYRPEGRNVFSLANMLEPGSFDENTIHDLKTSGLTIFMQISGPDPLDDLTEMLQRSYQLAGLLGARLCNSRHNPLTEQDAENYRARVSEFIA